MLRFPQHCPMFWECLRFLAIKTRFLFFTIKQNLKKFHACIINCVWKFHPYFRILSYYTKKFSNVFHERLIFSRRFNKTVTKVAFLFTVTCWIKKKGGVISEWILFEWILRRLWAIFFLCNLLLKLGKKMNEMKFGRILVVWWIWSISPTWIDWLYIDFLLLC